MTRRQGRAPLSRMLSGSGTSGHVPSAAGAAAMRSRTHRPALHSGRTRPWTGRPASCSRRCCGSKTAVAQRRARAPTGRGAAASARTGAVGGGRSPGDGGPGDPKLRPGQEPPSPPRKVTQLACPRRSRGCGRCRCSRFPLPEMASHGRSGPAAVTARPGRGPSPTAEDTRCGEAAGKLRVGRPPARPPAPAASPCAASTY